MSTLKIEPQSYRNSSLVIHSNFELKKTLYRSKYKLKNKRVNYDVKEDKDNVIHLKLEESQTGEYYTYPIHVTHKKVNGEGTSLFTVSTDGSSKEGVALGKKGDTLKIGRGSKYNHYKVVENEGWVSYTPNPFKEKMATLKIEPQSYRNSSLVIHSNFELKKTLYRSKYKLKNKRVNYDVIKEDNVIHLKLEESQTGEYYTYPIHVTHKKVDAEGTSLFTVRTDGSSKEGVALGKEGDTLKIGRGSKCDHYKVVENEGWVSYTPNPFE